MKLTPRELLHFVELWSALGLPPRRAALMLETALARKQRKRRKCKERGRADR